MVAAVAHSDFDDEEPTVVETPRPPAHRTIAVSVRLPDGHAREFRVMDNERNRAALNALGRRR